MNTKKFVEEDSTLNIVHDWVTGVLKRSDMSAREWAIKANIAPSPLQRFIKEKPWVLSATVISKLSGVSGCFPPLNPLDDSVRIQNVSVQLMRIKKGELVDTGKKYTTSGGDGRNYGPPCFAIPIQWETMDAAGWRIGEMIVVDPEEKPRNGDVVMVKNVDKFGIYEVYDHMLLAKSTKQLPNLDAGTVDIIGVIVKKEIHFR